MATSASSQPEDYSGLLETQGKGRNYLFYIVIVAFLLILGIYFSVDSPQQEIELEAPLNQEAIDPAMLADGQVSMQPVSTGNPDKRVQKAELAALSRKASPSAGEVGSAATLLGAGDTARSLIHSVKQGDKNLSMEQLFGQAYELQQQAMNTDAYLLYFYTARKGHGPSAFELASMHDPAHFQAGSDLLDSPDPVQAYKWYSIAAENNVEGAEVRLHALRNSIEVAATGGDLGAQRLLLNWK